MIILGVDGGGSKTSALVLDEHGDVLGSALGGPSGYHVIGLEAALKTISTVSCDALGGLRADIAVFCLGDCDSATDQARLSDGIAPLGWARQIVLYNDTFAALRAGTSRPYGVSVICGTGFNACGIAPDGKTAKLYALGPLTGDWGGGGALGTAVFGAVYRADDGRGDPTILTEMLIEALQISDLAVLAQRIADDEVSYAQVVALAPLVFAAAERGDSVAQAIITRQADEIATSALALLKRLDMTGLDVDVVLGGGIIKGQGSLLVDRVTALIKSVCPLAQIRRLEVPPVIGAAFLGFDRLKLATPPLARYRELDLRADSQFAG